MLLDLTSDFLHKASKVNDPLERLYETNQYDSFVIALSGGINKQAKFISGEMNKASILPIELRPLSGDEQAKLNAWLVKNMPKLSSYVSQQKVSKFFKFSFEWGVTELYKQWVVNKMVSVKDLSKATNPLANMSEEEAERLYMEAVRNNVGTPPHQAKLEHAVQTQDWDKVNEILDSIPQDDPYKATMEQEFRARAQQGMTQTNAISNSKGFKLYDKFYTGSLDNQANYLLNKSTIDQTTRDRIFTIIRDGKLNLLTNDEIAKVITSEFETISAERAFMIARTETAQAMMSGQMAGMRESGVRNKQWITAGANICPICDMNADQGMIGINEQFNSGDDAPPAHPNCECYVEAGIIDLSEINLWDGE